MIHVKNVTDQPHMFGEHHLLLESANVTLPQARYALLSSTPELHPALIDVLAGARPPRRGTVHHDLLSSWPIGRMGFVRGKLTGIQMTRFICSLYGSDPLACLDFLMGIMTSPEFLRKRIMDWPIYVRQEYIFALPLTLDFKILFVDSGLPLEDSRFSRLWQSLFEERLIGNTLILSSPREDQILDYCTKGLIYESGTFRIDDDLDQCIRKYTLRQSRAGQPGGGGDWIGDDDQTIGESDVENAFF